MKVTFIREPFFSDRLYPSDTMMVVTGYEGGGRMLVMEETMRLFDHYNGFYGKKVFIPYTEVETASRTNRWRELSADRINMIWRCEYE